jgi:hypothetical protein
LKKKTKISLDVLRKIATVSRMNSTIAFLDGKSFLTALTSLELVGSPHYVPDIETLTITCESDADRDDLVALLAADGLYPALANPEDDDAAHYPAEIAEKDLTDEEKDMNDDAVTFPGEAMDGDFDSAMASAGFGTDEDYGCFGGCEDE